MASSKPGSSSEERRERDRSEKPSPLRIVKRFGSEDSFCSPRSLSLRSNTSIDQHKGEDGCLTVMKRKRERNCDGFILDRTPHHAVSSVSNGILRKKYDWQDGMVCKGGMNGSQTLNVRKTRQPRPSLQSHLGLRMQYARTPSASSTCPSGHTLENFNSMQEKGQCTESPTTTCSQDTRQNTGPSRLSSPALTPTLHHLQNKSCILCPHVAVSTEVNALQDNQRTIWAAIEVSGRLSTLASKVAACDRAGVVTGTFIEHELDRFFEFGCLYDLAVEILPTPQTTVVQVLREQNFPTTIYAGSSILLLAEIRINVDQKCPQRPGQQHVRQKSEELIEDLEIQLGSSQINYMQIKVSYAHSVFPESSCDETETGISSTQSRIETVATASLKRHMISSPWSLRPAPSYNPLFQLVERHWGGIKASEAMQKMLATRSSARKPARSGSPFSLEGNMSVMTGSLPVDPILPIVPTRQASLQKKWTSECCRQNNDADVSRGILSSHGSTNSEESQTHSTSRESRSPKSRSCLSDVGSSEDSGNFLRKRGSFGRDGLKSLFPDLADLISDSYNRREQTSRPIATAGKGKGKKDTGRWAWASWF